MWQFTYVPYYPCNSSVKRGICPKCIITLAIAEEMCKVILEMADCNITLMIHF